MKCGFFFPMLMGRYSVDTVFVLLLPKYGTMIEDGELFKHVEYHHFL